MHNVRVKVICDKETAQIKKLLKYIDGELIENVENPSHCTIDGLEPYQSIDLIKETLTPEEWQGFCKGNYLKYVIRHQKKNGAEDIAKAKVYFEWLLEAKNKENK